ncbi:macrophage mannose receptor 1-like [Platichthys flesus]|uniref:macrophage mannose receptor 1-like n=1 Tax=Platichthys flesus TaxID=8260 RepID=UPI002DBC6BF5|nr:macrophage mannose receptor 1-like [Platichthys flesus]
MEGIFIGVLCLSGCLTFSTCLLHQYHFVSEAKNWTEAQRYCREKYTDLATIENTEEMKKLNDTVSVAGHSSEVWIGLYSHIDWKWSDGFNQSGAEYRKWEPPDPSNSKPINELCVIQIKSGNWYDTECHEQCPFVCYNGTLEDSDFVLVNTSKNWTEAQRHCRENYTDLVTVRNDTDNCKICNLKPHGNRAWIGLYRDPQIYWSDGSNYSFSSWYQGFNPLGLMKVVCGVADLEQGGKWRLCSCEERKPFVCYSMEMRCLTFSTCLLHQYHFVSEAKTWTEAQSYCREKYTDLATIENTEEMKKLKDTVSATGQSSEVWIGLYSHIDWKWSDGFNNSGAECRSWNGNDPNYEAANELCVVQTESGTWYDIKCHVEIPFVCYNGNNVLYIDLYYTT